MYSRKAWYSGSKYWLHFLDFVTKQRICQHNCLLRYKALILDTCVHLAIFNFVRQKVTYKCANEHKPQKKINTIAVDSPQIPH